MASQPPTDVNSPAHPPATQPNTTATSANTKSYHHASTYLPSKIHPIALRTVRPGEGAIYAHLVDIDGSGGLDAEWGDGAIARAIKHEQENPTVVDLDTGRVISGPARLNLLVVTHEPVSGKEEGDGKEGEEKVIGITGYGALKDWTRDGKYVRAGDAGVVIDHAYRGKGYATEAMRLSMDLAAAPASEGGLQLDIITVTTLETNEPMVRLADDKLGLKGGVLRPAEFDKNKQEKYWEMTAAEWREMRGH